MKSTKLPKLKASPRGRGTRMPKFQPFHRAVSYLNLRLPSSAVTGTGPTFSLTIPQLPGKVALLRTFRCDVTTTGASPLSRYPRLVLTEGANTAFEVAQSGAFVGDQEVSMQWGMHLTDSSELQTPLGATPGQLILSAPLPEYFLELETAVTLQVADTQTTDSYANISALVEYRAA